MYAPRRTGVLLLAMIGMHVVAVPLAAAAGAQPLVTTSAAALCAGLCGATALLARRGALSPALRTALWGLAVGNACGFAAFALHTLGAEPKPFVWLELTRKLCVYADTWTLLKGAWLAPCSGVVVDRRWVLSAAHCARPGSARAEVGIGPDERCGDARLPSRRPHRHPELDLLALELDALGGVPSSLPSISRRRSTLERPAPPQRCFGIASSARDAPKRRPTTNSRSENQGHPLGAASLGLRPNARLPRWACASRQRRPLASSARTWARRCSATSDVGHAGLRVG